MIDEFEKFSSKTASEVRKNKSNLFASGLKSITTFDCTLLTRSNPGVRPSSTVKKMKERFRFVPFCLTGGQVPPLLNFGNEQKFSSSPSSNSDKKYKSFAEVLSSPEASSQSVSLAELRMILEWKDAETSRETTKAVRDTKNDNNNNKQESTKINLLKMDIESFEYVSVSRWLELDLYQIRQQQQQQQNAAKSSSTTTTTTMKINSDRNIDFQKFPFLEVEQLQIELHRRDDASPDSAMWMMWLQMTMYALGFMPVVTEKNHYSNCCFEQVLVHYRYFVESELLMPMVL